MSRKAGSKNSVPPKRMGTTSSRRSGSNYASTASDLAKETVDFGPWAKGVKMQDSDPRDIPDDDDLFASVLRLRHISYQLPRWLSDPDSTEMRDLDVRYTSTKKSMCKDLQAFISRGEVKYKLHANEDKGLVAMIGVIHQVAACYSRLDRHQDLVNESSMRSGLNHLMASTWEEGEEDGHIVHVAEKRLKLPDPDTEGYLVATTKADAVSLLCLAGFPPYSELDDPGARKLLSAVVSESEFTALYLVHCVTEYKQVGSGLRQTLMGMVSGLYQRKVLGMTKQFVFGVAQVGQTNLQVMAGIWRDEKIVVCTIGQYSLVNPLALVRLYLVLRGMKELGIQYRQELMDSEHSIKAMLGSKPPRNIWFVAKPEAPEEGSPKSSPDVRKLPGAQEESDYREKVYEYLESMRPAGSSSLVTDTESDDSLRPSPVSPLPPSGGEILATTKSEDVFAHATDRKSIHEDGYELGSWRPFSDQWTETP